MKLLLTKKKSRITNVSVTFQGGAAQEPLHEFKPGTAHFLEHFMFKGTATRDHLRLSKDMAFIGADPNAHTSHDHVSYHYDVPTENLEKSLEIFCDMIKNPIFPESELEKERQVILEELATSKDDHYTTFFEFIAKNVYASFYGNPILGTEESINSIQIEDLKKFYDKFYKKESMVVSVVSSLKEEEIKILLEKYLYPVDDKFQRLLEYDAKVAIKDDADLLIEKKELQQSLCYVGYKCPNLRSKDAYAVKILASILGDGMDSRLFHSVREDKNLVYSISADVSADVSYGIFYSLFFTRNPEEAYEAVDLEIKKLLEHGLYEEEVQRTKNKIKSVLYKVDESPTTLSNVNLSYFLQRNKVPKLRLNSSIKKIEKVTIDDLMRVAKKIFSEKRMRITMKQEASAVGEE